MNNPSHLPKRTLQVLAVLAVIVFTSLYIEMSGLKSSSTQDLIQRAYVRQKVERMKLHLQDELANPTVCRDLFRNTDRQPVSFFDKRKSLSHTEESKIRLMSESLLNDSDIVIKDIYLNPATSKSPLIKSGVKFQIYKTHLSFVVTSKSASYNSSEETHVPLAITTGPENSHQIVDCVSLPDRP